MKGIVLFSTALLFCLISSAQTPVLGQGFDINNCVSQFSLDGIDFTKVGYQFWFVDKEFLDGRTLKMSAVAPFKATHAPHSH